MLPATLSAVLGGLTNTVVGAVLGFLSAYILFKLTQKRKLIEYEISSMPLLRFNPSINHALTVSVDKYVLTSETSDIGTSVSIKNAYGFQIDLQNVGGEPILQPNIKICLNSNASILEFETQPITQPGYEVTAQKDSAKSHLLHISVPFINEQEHLLIRLISTGNKDRECQIDILGAGIKARRRKDLLNTHFLISFIITCISLSVAYINTIPPKYLIILPTTPFGIIALLIGIVSVLWFVISFYKDTQRTKKRRFSQNQGWDNLASQTIEKKSFLQQVLK